MHIVPLLTLALLSSYVSPAEWPQFRGPGGQGHGDATNLPVRWSENEHVTWKTAIPGTGWSSPVIRGSQIWVTTAIDDGRSLCAVCVDRKTGAISHNVEVFHVDQPEMINPKNSYASPTPVLDEGRLYVHFGTYGTACLNADTSEVQWRNQELKLEHKEGPGSSPVLWQDRLILTCDGLDVQFVAALHTDTGHLVWKTPRTGANNPNLDFRKTYGTPLVITHEGQHQLISTGADRVYAYDPASGKELWWANYKGFSNVPRPLYAHGLLYICTGFARPQLWAIRPGGKGDVTETHVVWQFAREAPKNPSPIIVGQELYMVSDRGVLACLDALSGKELWTHRLGGNYSASPVYADGRLYFCSEEGQAFVLAPGKEFKLLATNQLDGRLMASPAVVERALFLRTDTHLYRIEQRPEVIKADAVTGEQR
jgi:outer membrane protein assembly factor BamB